jgi:hypothetical protein
MKGFSREPEGRRPFERTGRRWEEYIKMDLREVGLDRSGSGQGEVNAVMKLLFP